MGACMCAVRACVVVGSLDNVEPRLTTTINADEKSIPNAPRPRPSAAALSLHAVVVDPTD